MATILLHDHHLSFLLTACGLELFSYLFIFSFGLRTPEVELSLLPDSHHHHLSHRVKGSKRVRERAKQELFNGDFDARCP